MANLLETAVLAANAGAAVLREKWSQPRQIQRKQRFDFVTDADRASQDAVLSAISRLRPGDAILAEEDAEDYSHAAGTPGVLWVIDPLDGTTNFIHGFPMVAVSVAAVVDGIPEAGVVIDVVRNEVFSAERGKGAWLNGQDIAVHGIADRSQCLLLTGFPFRDRARLDRYMELFKELFRQVSGMRRAGGRGPGPGLCGRRAGPGLLGTGPQALGHGRGHSSDQGSWRDNKRFRRWST